jgi:hypothetical protein
MASLTVVNKIITVWKRVFSKKKYVVVGIAVALLFYLINGFIVAAPNLMEFFRAFGISAVWKLILIAANYSYHILPETFIGIIILSTIIGTLVSLLVYRFDNFVNARGGGILATVGIFLGMAAPGCAVCGVGLISLLGFGSILVSLPYNGRKIMIIAILLNAFSVLTISRKLYNPICKINIQSNERRKNE